MLQLLKPARLEPLLCNKRSHRNEKPAHRDEEQPPLAATREKPTRSNEDPMQREKKKKKEKKSPTISFVNCKSNMCT